ncbi:hypothetical protein CWS02_17180 [Enterobacter sp. EA-1]|nr:hypothetical protein CWS02_17180 [Enterobacter sp. EA-1]
MQTGGVLSAKPPANGIDLRQKKLIWRNRFPFPLRFMQFLAIFLPNKSFSGINRLCHTALNCYECYLKANN